MKKKTISIALTVLLATGLIVSGAYAYKNIFSKPEQKAELTENDNNDNDQIIGGQKDEHGCLIAAGYSWCEAKQKCLRTWEESCVDNTQVGPPTYDAVKNYLLKNLSTISPEKEVLGGKFYITQLELIGPDKGQVSYEDGHNAFKATFDYSLTNNQVKISNFKITSPAAPPAQKQETVTLTFQPMQCETEPWQEWYAKGEVNFLKAPTDEELIKTYYGTEKNINIISAAKITSNQATCLACSACKKDYSFTAKVSSQDAPRLEALGWKK